MVQNNNNIAKKIIVINKVYYLILIATILLRIFLTEKNVKPYGFIIKYSEILTIYLFFNPLIVYIFSKLLGKKVICVFLILNSIIFLVFLYLLFL